jgi:hypothetical protein
LILRNFDNFDGAVRADNRAQSTRIAGAVSAEFRQCIPEAVYFFPFFYLIFGALLYAQKTTLAPVLVNNNSAFFQVFLLYYNGKSTVCLYL